jgi:hypothetical protein
MIVRLIRAGHTPKQAKAWAGQLTAWPAAQPESIDAFAAGIANLSRERQSQQPPSSHLSSLADAADCWAQYRSGARLRAGTPHA